MKKIQGRRGGIKSLLVEPFEQIKLGLIFLSLNLVFSLVSLSVFTYYLYDIYKAMAVYFKLSESESILTANKFAVPAVVVLVMFAVFVAATLFVSIRYTHAIYGPLVSINRFLDELLAGQPPHVITLRETDQLRDLADKLNRVAERMETGQRSGPLVAIHRFLDDIISGKKPAPLTLREGDSFRELSEKLNKLAAQMTVQQ
ncbi:MAG: hypothetical protein RIQ81_1971 [Pseudomonadota bacterium]|jgi:hypothetical protein